MVREPVFDNPSEGTVHPVACITLDEVRCAERQEEAIMMPMAHVTHGREAGYSLKLTNIRGVTEYDDGAFAFIGDAVQLVTRVLHRHEVETTVQLEGRSSICSVLVSGGHAMMTFTTIVTYTELTEPFLSDEE